MIKAKAREDLNFKIFGENWMMALLAYVVFGALIAAANVLPGAGPIILLGPLTYGMNYLFLKVARTKQTADLGDLFKGFTDDFGGTLLIGLMSSIFTFLWMLLLIVPGIVKSYAYSMAYYIKADHPEYDWKACLDQSQAMMKGHKWEFFVLQLSFLGWIIVGSLCLGIGMLWVSPYMETAKAEFYESIKSYVMD